MMVVVTHAVSPPTGLFTRREVTKLQKWETDGGERMTKVGWGGVIYRGSPQNWPVILPHPIGKASHRLVGLET